MEHNIDPQALQPKGSVRTEIVDSALRFTTLRRIPSEFEREHLSVRDRVEVPGLYRLPLRITFSARIDEPGFYLLLGEGHISLGTPWSDNRRLDDIIAPTRKPFFFHNHIPMGRFVDVTVTYDRKALQVIIDGEERYFSTKERYQKAKDFAQRNAEGFVLAFACDKGVHAEVRALTITEYADAAPVLAGLPASRPAIQGNEAALPDAKPAFEGCIARLPDGLRTEAAAMDAWLRSLPGLKFRRQIEPHGNKITYVAAAEGLSYAILPSNDTLSHRLEWYIVTNGPTDTWARKGDRMEQTLNALAQDNQALAQRLYDNLWECVGCYPADHCLARTRYGFAGQSKITCHGRLRFAMSAQGFEDARALIEAVRHLPGPEQPA